MPSSRLVVLSATVLLLAVAGLAPLAAQEQALSFQSGERRAVNPIGVPAVAPVYSQAVRKGDFIFVAGTTGVDPETGEVVPGGVGPQTRQTMENIQAILESEGSRMSQVLECTVFLVDMDDYGAMNGVYGSFFPSDPPARATLAVSELPRAAARVEIKCSAAR